MSEEKFEKFGAFDYACVVLLISSLVFIGGLFGYQMAPNMPVFDVAIKAPAAPNPPDVFPPVEYIRGVSAGIAIGRAKEYDLLAPAFNKVLKQAYRPYCRGCVFATDTVLGAYLSQPVTVGDTIIKPSIGTRLRVIQMYHSGHWNWYVEALPSWEDIFDGVQ